jgi:biopolymer transport protein ExbD
VIAGLLLAAATTAGPPVPVAERRQAVAVRWDAETKSCVPTVRGVDTGDVESDAGKAALAAALPDKGAELHVSGTGDVPYACVADMIQALQRSGYYGRIDLTTGPKPAQAAR